MFGDEIFFPGVTIDVIGQRDCFYRLGPIILHLWHDSKMIKNVNKGMYTEEVRVGPFITEKVVYLELTGVHSHDRLLGILFKWYL